MNKVWLGIGVAAGLAASVGIASAIRAVDRSELPEWLGGPASHTPVSSQDRAWDKFVAVEDLSQPEFSVWPGTLKCEPWSRWDGFTRDKDILVGENMVAHDNGDVQAFIESTQGGVAIPAELSARFEWWRGEIDGTSVVMEGWYTAVTDDLKSLRMTGELVDDVLLVEGTRGPRDCRVEARRPE